MMALQTVWVIISWYLSSAFLRFEGNCFVCSRLLEGKSKICLVMVLENVG